MSTTVHEEIAVGQIVIRFVLDGEASGGTVAMFEFDVPAGAKVPIPHSHDAFDETLYGLEGTLTWTVAGTPTEVGPGEVLHIPRGVVHHFDNAGTVAARALAVVTPAILGPGYFHESAAVLAAAAGGPPDVAAMVAVMRRHGLTPVPDGGS
jgi:quercetin dioxygenase-like cupin family protein